MLVLLKDRQFAVLLELKNAQNAVLFHTLIPPDSRGVGGNFSKNVTKLRERASPAATALPNGLGQAVPVVPPGEPQRAVDGVRRRRTGLGQGAQEAMAERARQAQRAEGDTGRLVKRRAEEDKPEH